MLSRWRAFSGAIPPSRASTIPASRPIRATSAPASSSTASAACSASRRREAPTGPGKYKEWGPDIDEIEIAKTFKLAGYDRIIVEPFDTSKVPLPDQKAKWYGTMKMTLAGYTQAFAEALEKELKAKAAVEQAN